jgi:hypothetical protein
MAKRKKIIIHLHEKNDFFYALLFVCLLFFPSYKSAFFMTLFKWLLVLVERSFFYPISTKRVLIFNCDANLEKKEKRANAVSIQEENM